MFTALALAVMIASPCYAVSITASIFPVYDWVREISKGVSNDITLLLDRGADLHSYQPSAEDIVRISDSDLFVYVGGESDEWADDVLKVSGKNHRHVINLLEILGDSVKPEKLLKVCSTITNMNTNTIIITSMKSMNKSQRTNITNTQSRTSIYGFH